MKAVAWVIGGIVVLGLAGALLLESVEAGEPGLIVLALFGIVVGGLMFDYGVFGDGGPTDAF